MCGIAGIASLTQINPSKDQLKPMADALIHRGPDAAGFYADPYCGLAHRRLKILDLSDAANQPMLDDASGSVLIFNGEIYNHALLRVELEKLGVGFTTTSDTEVLLKGLIHHGEAFISRLEGDFAFCFRSSQKNETLLARDRFGIKPLYICESSDKLIFASEIKALFAGGVDKEIAHDFIAEYFRYRYVGGLETLFKGIQHFPAGHYLKLAAGHRVLKKYYAIGSDACRKGLFGENFAAAVGGRLQADVKVGLFLSGGVDSSAIAAQSKLLNAQVESFTYSFGEESGPLDETAAARALAERCGFAHHKISDPGDLYLKLPEIITALEEPIGDSIIMANFQLFKKTKMHAGVALSGEGADEIFSSYAHHRAIKLTLFLRRYRLLANLVKIAVALAPLKFLNFVSFYPAKLSLSLKKRILGALNAQDEQGVYQSFSALFEEDELADLLQSNYRRDRGFYSNSPQQTDLQNWLPKYGLLRVDKLSMAHSLEVRLPFLSHFVVDSALADFTSTGFFSGDKSAFRRFCVETLNFPTRVKRQKKQPFYDPQNSAAYRDYASSVLTAARIGRFGIMNPSFVDSLLSAADKDFLQLKKINCLLVFQLWCEAFFE